MNHRSSILAVFLLLTLTAASHGEVLSLIPQPVQAKRKPDVFQLRSNTSIIISSPNLRPVATWLQHRLFVPTGFNLEILEHSSRNDAPSFKLSLLSPRDPVIRTEGYCLEVTPSAVKIQANDPAGLFYGMQTLLQLMPASIESRELVKGKSWTITSATIVDYPRFAWRGLM